MTDTAQTWNTLTAILEENGDPATWTESEALALWDSCPSRYLFDDFQDFMCSLIVRARSAY